MRWLVLIAVGCTSPADAPPIDAAVARVGSETIAPDEVASLVRVTGATPREALQDLVSERLLVEHARAYESSALVRQGVVQASVRRLLADEIGPGEPAEQRARLEALLARLRAATKVHYQQETIDRAFSH